MTKAYTLNVLIKEVSSLSSTEANSFSSLVAAISPRAGSSGQKVSVLNSFVGGQLRGILSGQTSLNVSGGTPKARLLSALRNRKRGTLFS